MVELKSMLRTSSINETCTLNLIERLMRVDAEITCDHRTPEADPTAHHRHHNSPLLHYYMATSVLSAVSAAHSISILPEDKYRGAVVEVRTISV